MMPSRKGPPPIERSHAHWHVKKRHILRHNLQDVLFWSASDGGADTVVVVFFGAPRSPPRPTWGRPGDRRVAPLRGHGGRQGLAQEGGQARCCSSVLVFAVPKQEDPPPRGWRRQTFVLVLLAGEEHSNQERVRGGKSIMLLFSLCTINCSRFAPPPCTCRTFVVLYNSAPPFPCVHINPAHCCCDSG